MPSGRLAQEYRAELRRGGPSERALADALDALDVARDDREVMKSAWERQETRADEALVELEIVGNFLAAGSFTDERVAILRRRVDAALARGESKEHR